MADTTTSNSAAEVQPVAQPDGSSAFTPVNDTSVKVFQDSTPEAVGVPSTPGKKTPKAKEATAPEPLKEPKTPKSKTTPAKRTVDGEATPKSAKKAKGTTTTDRKGIPTSVDEMTEEDKMLIKFKQEGKPWSAINTEWERLTGNKPASSTLPNRYNRIKAAISVVSEADVDQLKASVTAVEAVIEAGYKVAIAKKWGHIAQHMKENGVETEYQAGTIEKHWRKLQATAKVTPPAVDSGVESSSEQVEGEEVKEEAKAEE